MPPNGTTQGEFASAISSLQLPCVDSTKKTKLVVISRDKRTGCEETACMVMRLYRDAVPHSHQLRGIEGEDYTHENSVVIATHEPDARR